MKRKIIKINEDLCDGCGNCVVGCSEGALQIVNGKAKLVKEDFCDGFGDCIGTCPTGALTIEERDAADFDIEGVKEHLMSTQGEDAVKRMEDAQQRHESKEISQNRVQRHVHNQNDNLNSTFSGCPGMRMHMRESSANEVLDPHNSHSAPSELTHWPVQIHLVRPDAPFFKNREIVILSTCSPVAMADVHRKYIKGRSVVVGCPKLDNTDPYAEKLGAILSEKSIPKAIILRMEVPCCGGLTMIVNRAAEISARDDLIVEEHIIGLDGSLKQIRDYSYDSKSKQAIR